MKTRAIFKIVICSLILVIFIPSYFTYIAFASNINGNLRGINLFCYNPNIANYSVGNVENVDKTGITKINVLWASGSVIVEKNTEDKLSITENSIENIQYDEQMRWNVANGTLDVVFRNSTLWGWDLDYEKDLIIKVPETMFLTLQEVSIGTMSANASVSDLTVSNVNLESVSGAVAVKDSNINGKIKASTVSGSINCINCEKLAKLEIESVSGSSQVNVVDSFLKTFDISTVSGNCDLTLPNNSSFSVEVSSIAGGGFSSDTYGVTKVGNIYKANNPNSTSLKIKIDSVSGRLRVI